MDHIIESELQAQQSVKTFYALGHLVAFSLCLLCARNNVQVFCMLILLIQMIAHLFWWQNMKFQMHNRIRLLQFKTQIENLYVTSEPDYYENDMHAYQTYKDTIQALIESKNPHGIKVHLILWRDVIVRTTTVKADGTTVVEPITWRPKGVINETFEQYQGWCNDFVFTDKEKQLRKMRAQKQTFDWVNKNIFKQQTDE